MSAADLLTRGATATCAALAGFLAHAEVALLLDAPGLGPGPLASAAVAGLLGALRRPTAAPPSPRPAVWILAIALPILLAVGTALVVGTLGSPARDWDGAVGWELRARWLAAEPTLDQPFFADVAVYGHTREYPLLQPLVHAQAIRLFGDGPARLVFVAGWLVLIGLAMATWRRLGVSWNATWLLATALGATPMLASPTSGGVDSGYAELAVATTLTAAAAGLATRDHLLLFLGTFLLTSCKPEGMLLAGGVLVVPWVVGDRRALCAAGLGLAAALTLWLPLHARLLDARPEPALLLAASLGALAAFVGLGIALAQLATPRTRVVALLALAFGLASAATLDGSLVPGALGQHVAGIADPTTLAQRLPDLLLALAGQAVAVNRFGLAWIVAVALAVVGTRPKSACPTPGLAVLLVLGLGLVTLAGLTTPEDDLPHFVRSSLDRLLLQQIGVLWLLVGTWGAAAVGARPPDPGRPAEPDPGSTIRPTPAPAPRAAPPRDC